jgi:hypothetical protein
MINTILLAGALLVSGPMNAEEVVEPPTSEVEEFQEQVFTLTKDNEKMVLTLTSETECKIEYFTGETLNKTLTATYTLENNVITITSGENVIKANLNVDGTFTEYVESKSDFEKWLSEWLDASTVATIMSYVAYLGTIIGLVAKLRTLKQNNNLTLENVKDTILSEVGDKISTETRNEIEKYLPSILETSKNQKEILEVFAKVLCLSQENTAESKVAILNLISQIGIVDNKVVETAKKEVETQKVEEETKKVENTESLDKIIKDNGTSI